MDQKIRKEISECLKDMDTLHNLAMRGVVSHEDKDALLNQYKAYIAESLQPKTSTLNAADTSTEKEEPKPAASSGKSRK